MITDPISPEDCNDPIRERCAELYRLLYDPETLKEERQRIRKELGELEYNGHPIGPCGAD